MSDLAFSSAIRDNFSGSFTGGEPDLLGAIREYRILTDSLLWVFLGRANAQSNISISVNLLNILAGGGSNGIGLSIVPPTVPFFPVFLQPGILRAQTSVAFQGVPIVLQNLEVDFDFLVLPRQAGL